MNGDNVNSKLMTQNYNLHLFKKIQFEEATRESEERSLKFKNIFSENSRTPVKADIILIRH